MSNKMSLDSLIKEGVKLNMEEELSKDIDIDIDKQWKQFEAKYYDKKNSFLLTNVALLAMPVILSIGILVSLLAPTQVNALSLKTLDFFKSFLAGKVQTVGIDYENKNTRNINTKKMENLIRPEILEKLNSVPYNVFLPMDKLNEYEIASCDVQKTGDSFDVRLDLLNDNDQKIIIQQVNITRGFAEGLSFDNDDSVYKKVRINGQEASLIVSKKTMTSISWIESDIHISMSGRISEEKMLSLATSMRRLSN